MWTPRELQLLALRDSVTMVSPSLRDREKRLAKDRDR